MAGHPPFDFAAIDEIGDRSQTMALLALVLDPTSDLALADKAVTVLQELADPRVVVPLLQTLAAPDTIDIVRDRAAQVLPAPTGAELREWFHSPHPAMRSIALRNAGAEHGDLLRAVLDDPSASAADTIDALFGILFTFEEPEWLGYVVAALENDDPAVATAAANILFWDEPVVAEDGLLRALQRGGDLAVEAARTLTYYPTRRVVDALVAFGPQPQFALAWPPDPVDAVLDSFRDAMRQPAAVSDRMRSWVGRVADMMDFEALMAEWRNEQVDLGPDDPVKTVLQTPGRETIGWDESLRTRTANPDEPIKVLLADLRRLDLDSIPLEVRRGWTVELCRHPCTERRERGALLAAHFGFADSLLELMDDPNISVRKSAVYDAGSLDRNALIADRVLALLESGAVCSTQGREALATWVRHVDQTTATKRLLRFARDDRRESVVVQAIQELGDGEYGADSIRKLLDLLHRPPLKTWSTHVSILEGCARYGIDPGSLDHLRLVDNVWLQTAIVRVDVALGR
jgi:hypothetical protein